MDRTSTGEVETREIEQPPVGVPGPVRDWAVHECGPPEAEDQRRDDSASFKGAADNYHGCAGAEEHFVEAEDNFGEDG